MVTTKSDVTELGAFWPLSLFPTLQKLNPI
uniref:Uncharacterized protein n=1 Tax=Myoviridae sp. ctshb19 TaxID=2825194 RepID=A0A8S5UG81_9CAUD|nr:MAG TPA: hypothetical protein [Myoviridae sp. ctshb19]